MDRVGFPKCQFSRALQFLLLVQTRVFCYQFKVGDLDAGGTPTSAKPQHPTGPILISSTLQTPCKFSPIIFFDHKIPFLHSKNESKQIFPAIDEHFMVLSFSAVFLYPPSQDSVIQITAASYNSCNLKYPILLMNNGNSVFNITDAGEFFFTSGVQGHCEKSQKLHISVPGNALPSYGSAALPETAPSYPTIFGSIPMVPSSSPSSSPSL
ncbi:hypothetical protein U1Q18_039951 [Sarracenia purpurea var. burkii]